MKDPDQPDLNDPRRREYDFQQAMAAQQQMASGTFGQHDSAILPGDGGGQSQQAEPSDAVKQSVTQVATSAGGTTVSTEQPRRPQISPEQIKSNREVRQDKRQKRDVASKKIQARKQVQQETANQLRQQFQSLYVQPGMPLQQANQNNARKRRPDDQAPAGNNQAKDRGDGDQPAMPPVLPMLQQVAPYERPVLEIKAPDYFEKNSPAPQAPPQAQRNQAPKLPNDRTAFAPSEPLLDPGGQTADPQKSAYQAKSLEQAMQFSEAMDAYGLAMGQFTESVMESLRVLTRRVNDMTRAIQGEGYDIR